MKDKKRMLKILSLVLPALAVLLKALPISVRLVWMPGPNEQHVELRSSFDPLPFCYGDIGPLITAILSSLLLLLVLIRAWKGKPTGEGAFWLCLWAAVFSLLPLLMFALSAYPIAAGAISLLLIAEAVVLGIAKKES